MCRGVARIVHWGPQKLSAEGARIEAPKACGAERSGDWGGGVPLPNRLWDLGERRTFTWFQNLWGTS